MGDDKIDIEGIIKANYPGLVVTGTPKDSGQRCVFFGRFTDFEIEAPKGRHKREWSKWGDIVVKVSKTNSVAHVSRMESEIHALKSISSPFFPKHHYQEWLTFNPLDESPLIPKLLVTIEEYIPSNPLSNLLGMFSDEKQAANLLRKLAEALSVLWKHEKSYVHRDIKPDNILIRDDLEPVIVDLGILREAGQPGITVTHLPIGPCTPVFASPEQLENNKSIISYKSDMFALGIIGYLLVAKHHPFFNDGDDLELLINNIVNVDHQSLYTKRLASKSYSDIIDKLLQKKPYKRYRKPEKFIADLKLI